MSLKAVCLRCGESTEGREMWTIDPAVVVLVWQHQCKIVTFPTSTARHIGYDFTQATGIRISDQTVCRRLHQGSLHSKRPMRSSALNQWNRGNRTNWALADQHWTIAEWRNVMFVDETRIGLRLDTRFVRVWKSARRHQEHRYVQEVHPFAGWCVMFWAAIMIGWWTPLIPIYGTWLVPDTSTRSYKRLYGPT